MPTPDLLTIGQLATRAGVAASALRFYESRGLLHTTRTESGQRRFHRDALRRVAFITAAQQLGFALDELQPAFEQLPADRPATADDWQRLEDVWQGALDERMALLDRLRNRPMACIGCGCLSLPDCTVDNPADIAGALGHGAHYLHGRTPADAAAGPQPRKRRESVSWQGPSGPPPS